jgi:streptogramin lyase
MPRKAANPSPQPAEIIREYGPFRAGEHVSGVTFDGESVWFAATDHLQAFDPVSGTAGRTLPVAADAGTAFDGRYFYQIAGKRIQKIDPHTGQVVESVAAPGNGGDSGLAWAEGTLWVANYAARKIRQIDPETGHVLRSVDSPRCVTGVTFTDGELWHGTWEGGESDLRRIDPETGEVLEQLTMPSGTHVSGLEAGREVFYCGGGTSGKVRAVRRPKH